MCPRPRPEGSARHPGVASTFLPARSWRVSKQQAEVSPGRAPAGDGKQGGVEGAADANALQVGRPGESRGLPGPSPSGHPPPAWEAGLEEGRWGTQSRAGGPWACVSE